MLAKSKWYCRIYAEFITVFKEKDRYEKLKYNLRNENENKKQKIIKVEQYKIKN